MWKADGSVLVVVVFVIVVVRSSGGGDGLISENILISHP